MRRGTLARGTVATLACGAVLAAPARADETINAAISNQYTNKSITIDQGEKVFFRNGDVAMHDVTARDLKPDGQPLFSSALIGQNQQAEVVGADALTTGSYAFYCSVHPFMTGSIQVTSAGTPAGGGSAPAPTDTTAPRVRARLLASKLGSALKAEVRSNEAARFSLRASARIGRRTVTLARRTTSLSRAGSRRVTLELTAAGRAAIRSRRRLTVRITATATDAAGNRARATGSRTLRR